jgi:hypothetical protein
MSLVVAVDMEYRGPESSLGVASLGSLRLCPHLLQNLKPAGGFEPQFGQITSISSDEPHAPQNIESSGFSNWHFGHCIIDALQI